MESPGNRIADSPDPREYSRGSGSAPGESSDDGDSPTPAEAFGAFASHLQELRDYFLYFVLTRLDLARLGIRRMLLTLTVTVMGMIAGGAVVVTAVVLACVGLAQAFTELTGHAWLGNVIAAAVLLIVAAVGGYLLFVAAIRRSHLRTFRAYERRRQRQRVRHGTDIHEQSRNS